MGTCHVYHLFRDFRVSSQDQRLCARFQLGMTRDALLITSPHLNNRCAFPDRELAPCDRQSKAWMAPKTTQTTESVIRNLALQPLRMSYRGVRGDHYRRFFS